MKSLLRSGLVMLLIIIGAALVTQNLGWAAVIVCTSTRECNGTSGDDAIYGHSNGNSIQGLEGNDYIVSSGNSTVSNFILGGDGNDRLIGSSGNDILFGGLGNDLYDGLGGSDTIVDWFSINGNIIFSDDIISGGEGKDWIYAGLGLDRINGGPGNDTIYQDASHRDFSSDIVNCGSDTGDNLFNFYSSDDSSVNCEHVTDLDR